MNSLSTVAPDKADVGQHPVFAGRIHFAGDVHEFLVHRCTMAHVGPQAIPDCGLNFRAAEMIFHGTNAIERNIRIDEDCAE